MSLNWAEYEGVSIGKWRLDLFLAVREEIAFYQTTNAQDGRHALIEIIPTDNAKSPVLRASWEAASKISEAHLLHVYDVGDAQLDGTRVAYVVVDLPDDDASEILTRFAFSADEARRIGAGAAAGLDFLHKNGLCHGSIAPSNIFFVGDSIKLSVDTIARAGDAGRESDIRQLGTTLIELATGNTEPEAARNLPAPLREVVLGCFESPGREWTADRVLRSLSENPPEAPDRALAKPRWLMGVVGAAALAILAFIGYRTTYQPDKPGAPDVVKTPARSPGPPSPSTTPPTEQVPAAGRRLDPRSSWAVVAATYKNRGAAQNRAKSIESHFPQLHVSVYPRSDGNNRYYVLLGSGMTQSQAEKLRVEARERGAPGDSYATKLPED